MSDKAFTRNRKLPFATVVLLILNGLKGSLMDELDQFFQALFKWDVSRRFVTPSAFSQARRKVHHRVFVDLLDTVCRFVNRASRVRTFRGLRVFAIDGSTMRLPDNPKNRSFFGITRNHISKRAMGRVSLLFDVFNRIPYDAILSPFNVGEISLAWQHLQEAELPKHSLIVFDRGYYDFALLQQIRDQAADFYIRLRSNLGIYRAFQKTGLDDAILTLKPPARLTKGAPKNSPYRRSFQVRVFRFRVKQTTFVIMTSLLNQQKYPLASLAELYNYRWKVEEAYKLTKCRIGLEHISGETSECALQDFHGRIFAASLTASLALDGAEEVSNLNNRRKLDYQISLTQAMAKMKNTIALLFLRKQPEPILEALIHTLTQSLVSIEPTRTYPRKGTGRRGPKVQTYTFGYRVNR